MEFDELDVLEAIKSGDILLVERGVDSSPENRSLIHRKEKRDHRYMQPGEEERVRRLA
jgi:hypothetical protein